MNMKVALLLLLLGSTVEAFDNADAKGILTEDADCVATALATADPSNSVGEAISNAIAQAFSRVVACNGNEETQHRVGASSLAISVAVAIASSETAGAECVAESDAVAEVVSDLVTKGVAGGLMENADPVQQTLAEAWLTEEVSAIATRLQEGEGSSGGRSAACSLSRLRNSLSTAKDVSAATEDAISQILLAVTCGDNIQTFDPEVATPEAGSFASSTAGKGKDEVRKVGSDSERVGGCRYDSKTRMFYGPCTPAKIETRYCNQEFRDCENAGRSSKACHEERTACSDAMLTDMVKKGIKSQSKQEST